MSQTLREIAGELLGTFIIVFVGCGTVGVSILFGTFDSLPKVALMWGLGVALAIYASRKLSGAHLNPAVTIALLLNKDVSLKKIPHYVAAQFVGAFLAALALNLLLSDSILLHEAGALTRNTAMMFGEFFPNPGFDATGAFSTSAAFGLEAAGTFFLAFIILAGVVRLGGDHFLFPILIGLTVTTAIVFIAPYTQAGINPARDLAPRLYAYVAGWGDAAVATSWSASLMVYVVAPIVGAVVAVPVFRSVKRWIS